MKQVERRLQTSKALVAYRSARNDRDSSQAAQAKVDSDMAGAKQAIAKRTADMPSAQAALQTVEMQHAEALKAVSEIQQQLAAKNNLLNTVALAASKAELCSRNWQAIRKLHRLPRRSKRAEQLAAEAGELQKQTAARQQSTNQSAAAVAAQKQALEVATADVTKYQQQVPALEAQHAALVEKLQAAEQQCSRTADDLLQLETRQFAAASLKPLTPEQIAWSVMHAVGLADQLRVASEAEINQKTPLTDVIRNDPAQMAARQRQIDDATYAKLQANAARFVELFGNGAGQPQTFFATADQALFLANDGQIRGWLAPGGGNLTERISKLTDAKSLADELYLSVLSRPPTDAEVAETSNYLVSRSNERPAAIQELAWALIASLEFRFNH